MLRRISRDFKLWTNPYADYGMYFVSLEFTDPRSEDGHASALLVPLARAIRNFSSLWLLALMGKIGMDLTFNFDPGDSDPDIYFEAKLASASIDVFFCILASILCFTSMVQLRSPILSLRQLELFLVVTLIIILGLGPLVPLNHAHRVLLGREPIQFESDTGVEPMVLFLFDLVTTFVSLTPARFSSLWILYAFAIVWYPLSSFLIVDTDLRFQIFLLQASFLIVLIVMAMFGKRMMEVQQRRWFCTVANERTLRAQSEFQLSQQDHSSRGARKTARSEISTGMSLDTADIFEHRLTLDAPSMQAKLKQIRSLANREHWLIDAEDVELNVSKLLGRGGFGAVVQGSMNGIPVAVKVSLDRMSSDGDQRVSSLTSEVRVLRQLRHPSIVSFYGAIIDADMCEVAVVLELASGPCLSNFIQMTKLPLPDDQSYRISSSTACALQYLHGLQPAIIHGDLKPSNIMVELAGAAASRAKLVDFGLSRILKGRVNGLGGSLAWKAPELLEAVGPIPSASVDTYGFGRVVLFLLHGQTPFIGWDRDDIRAALREGTVPGMMEPPSVASAVHLDLWNLGRVCTSLKPCLRPPTVQVSSQLRAMAVSCPRLLATSLEIWGFNEFILSSPTQCLLPWKDALLQFRQKMQPNDSSAGKSVLVPSELSQASSLTPSSRVSGGPASEALSQMLHSTSREEIGDSPKLPPILESAEDAKSQHESRSRTLSSSCASRSISAADGNGAADGTGSGAVRPCPTLISI